MKTNEPTPSRQRLGVRQSCAAFPIVPLRLRAFALIGIWEIGHSWLPSRVIQPRSSRRQEAPTESPCETENLSDEQDNQNHLTLAAPEKPEPIYTREKPREDGWYPPITPEEFELKYPGQPYDPYPESTVGNAVIMKREKPFQVVKKSTERIRLAPLTPLEVLRAHPVFQETCEGTFDLLSDGWYIAEQCDDQGTYFLITNEKAQVPFPWRQYVGDFYKGIYSVRKVQR